MIHCYKSFKKGLIDRDGFQYALETDYVEYDEIKVDKCGFHMYQNLEDALAFGENDNGEEFDLCEVTGYGIINEGKDIYYGIYGIYAAEHMAINKILSREEIINSMLDAGDIRVLNFLPYIDLSKEEIELFKEKYEGSIPVIDAIKYYQEEDKEVYSRKRKVNQPII